MEGKKNDIPHPTGWPWKSVVLVGSVGDPSEPAIYQTRKTRLLAGLSHGSSIRGREGRTVNRVVQVAPVILPPLVLFASNLISFYTSKQA